MKIQADQVPLLQAQNALNRSVQNAENNETSSTENQTETPAESLEADNAHALLRNSAVIGMPVLLAGTSQILGHFVQKQSEKAATAAIKGAMEAPALIKATLDSVDKVKVFPSLMGKGSTAVSATGFSKGLHTAVATKVNQSVAMTLNQAVATGSFMGTGNAVLQLEGKATQYTGKMAGSLGKYGNMFIDHLSFEKAQPYLQRSHGAWKATVSISADLNGVPAHFAKSSEHVQRLADGAQQAAHNLRHGHTIAQRTIVSTDMAHNIAKATEKSVQQTSQSRLAQAHRFLSSPKNAPIIMGAVLTGVTAWDAYHAIERTQDENASTAGKAMAWGTVALDAVAVGALMTKKPQIALPAVGLAIGSSVAAHFID